MILYVMKKSRGRVRGRIVRDRMYTGYYKFKWMTKVKSVPLGVTEKRVALKILLEIVRKEQFYKYGFSPVSCNKMNISSCLCDFLAVIRSLGRGTQYVKRLELAISSICIFCGWDYPGEISSQGFERWRVGSSLSPKSKNFYQSALNEFCRWLLRSGIISKNPLEFLPSINLHRIKRLKRKALSVEQIVRLLSVLPDFRLRCIVMMAIYTGLRRKELSRLVWTDLYLDEQNPVVIVPDFVTKNGKEAVQPLRAELVDALLKLRKFSVKEKVFGCFLPFWKLKKYWIMAGIPDSPEYDFHSLRVTFCTLLEQSGVPPRVAQEAMRHSDSRLTEQTYTDRSKLHVRAAINSLPSFRI